MSGVTPGPRQFTLMAPGMQAGNSETDAPWEVVPTQGSGSVGYYHQTKLDLRALVPEGSKTSDSKGLAWASVVLQEAGPFDMAGDEDETAFIIYDLLTTEQLSENQMTPMFAGLGVPSVIPGFLPPPIYAAPVPVAHRGSQALLNPSQVIFGLWRMMGENRNFTLGLDVSVQPSASSFFGEGEVVVGPEVWWTRFIAVINAVGTQIVIPSANLAIRADVVKLTTAQEMTQMMRGVAR